MRWLLLALLLSGCATGYASSSKTWGTTWGPATLISHDPVICVGACWHRHGEDEIHGIIMEDRHHE